MQAPRKVAVPWRGWIATIPVVSFALLVRIMQDCTSNKRQKLAECYSRGGRSRNQEGRRSHEGLVGTVGHCRSPRRRPLLRLRTGRLDERRVRFRRLRVWPPWRAE